MLTKDQHRAKLRKKLKKGVDDGQYYREQPISMPRRPSGADFQPQNPKPTDPDTNPSQLGSDHRNPDRDTYETEGEIKCPICGQNTLTYIDSLEALPEDARCTACGARFNAQDLKDAPLQRAEWEALHQNNQSQAITIPDWKVKGFTKAFNDGSMTVKGYVGFDFGPAYGQTLTYLNSKAYLKRLKEYFPELSEKELKGVVLILKNALSSGETMVQVANKLDHIFKDKERSNLIARTELIRASNEGNLERIEDKGITKKVKFLSAPEDGRLCNDCHQHNGQVYTLKEARGVVPRHPRCRCTWLEVEEP